MNKSNDDRYKNSGESKSESNKDSKSNNEKNQAKELYLYESKYDKENNRSASSYKSIVGRNLNNPNYSEKYRLWNADTNEEVINLEAVFDPPSKTVQKQLRILGSGTMDCLSGTTNIPNKKSQIYQVYKNASESDDLYGCIVNIKMDTHPKKYMDGVKTFLRYVSFAPNSKEHIIIDTSDLSLYTEVDKILRPLDGQQSFTNIIVSEISKNPDLSDLSKEILKNINLTDSAELLKDAFENDKEASFRIIRINNFFTFYCVILPNIKNSPSLIFLDARSYLNWNDKYNKYASTYFDNKIHEISSFSASRDD